MWVDYLIPGCIHKAICHQAYSTVWLVLFDHGMVEIEWRSCPYLSENYQKIVENIWKVPLVYSIHALWYQAAPSPLWKFRGDLKLLSVGQVFVSSIAYGSWCPINERCYASLPDLSPSFQARLPLTGPFLQILHPIWRMEDRFANW